MFNSFPHPWAVVDVLASVCAGVPTVMTVTVSSVDLGELMFCCWIMPVLDCDCGRLQEWMPSDHVWWRFALPSLPQFLNQEPPRPQQLIWPELSMMPHLEHMELMLVVTAAEVHMWSLVEGTKNTNTLSNSLFSVVSMVMYLHAINIELTFAGLHTLKPRLLNVSVVGSSTLLVPSTARSATTDSAGFLERAALETRHRIRDRWGNCWRADWRAYHWRVFD